MAITVWDLPVTSLYQHVLKFYRQEKEHIKLEYGQRMELLALFKQVKLGPYAPDKDTGTGYFDMVGSDRRKAWQNLGSISLEEAQAKVIALLEGVCPQMKEVVLNSYKGGIQEGGQIQLDQRCAESERQVSRGGGGGGGGMKEDGIKQQGEERRADSVVSDSSPASSSPAPPHQLSNPPSPPQPGYSPSPPQPAYSPSPPQPGYSPSPPQHALAPAALWFKPKATRKFIAELQSNPATVVPLHLVAGESVAVQVPTSPQASAIVWEFGTQQGDIGFGLTFQRRESTKFITDNRNLEELLPVMKRECSEDLLLGSHQYQDEGVYTLNFVNSHPSAPRVVHYRVFYQTSSGS